MGGSPYQYWLQRKKGSQVPNGCPLIWGVLIYIATQCGCPLVWTSRSSGFLGGQCDFIFFIHPPAAKACQCPWLSSAVSLLSRGLPLPGSRPQLPVSPFVALPPPIVPLPFPASSTPSLPPPFTPPPIPLPFVLRWPWAPDQLASGQQTGLGQSLHPSCKKKSDFVEV